MSTQEIPTVRMNEVGCADVTCSAVSCMSTGELHELVYAPHSLHQGMPSQHDRGTAVLLEPVQVA
jgi:hypothetical protein